MTIDVRPSDAGTKVAVATDLVGVTHFPVYKLGIGGTGVSPALVSESNPIPTSENAMAGVLSDVETVVTAGTRVRFGTNTTKTITIKAAAANTGVIYIGGSNVTAANGFPLAAGDTYSGDFANTDLVWMDSSVSGESCNWIAGT